MSEERKKKKTNRNDFRAAATTVLDDLPPPPPRRSAPAFLQFRFCFQFLAHVFIVPPQFFLEKNPNILQMSFVCATFCATARI